MDLLNREGVPCTSVNLSASLFDHPQILKNDLVAEHYYSDIGFLKYIGVPIKYSKTPGVIRRPAPELGGDTEEVLSGVGYSSDEIEQFRKDRIIK
tara:strand:+ start:85 stop:369 length:285 start_codon:yes stop_codon:yes gene_type:complete